MCAAAVGRLAFPTRMTTRRYGSGGVSLRNENVDIAFIKVGVTTRSEIADRLKAIDVNTPEPIFWGRWEESKWGVVAGSLPPLSTNSNPDAGSARHDQVLSVYGNHPGDQHFTRVSEQRSSST